MGTAPRKGFNLARRVGSTSTCGGLNSYKIASGYTTALGVGDSVKFTTDGTIIKGANSAGNVGVLNAVKYVDSTGQIVFDKYWPASTVATDIEALVIDDPLQTYNVLANNSIPETEVFQGQMYAMTLTAPDVKTGRSTMLLDTVPFITGDVDMSGYTTLVGDGVSTDADAFTIMTTNPATTATTITIATATTLTEFLADINAVSGIAAELNASTGFLEITATDGYLITTASTVGTPIADYFVATSHTAAGTKVVAIASSMVKIVRVVDRDNKQVEVALTLTNILADS